MVVFISGICPVQNKRSFFIMITGELLLEKEESISTLFRKRIRRIGIILVLFSFFYYIVNICRNPEVNFSPGGFF